MIETDAPLVTVLTPTWNRGPFLERVWAGLNKQSFRDFEWIICDDGSSDDTQSVVRGLIAKSDFPIILITASTHIGKARMDNEGVAQARGTFILWNDSDDFLTPDALQKFVAAWDEIPESERDQYAAVAGYCDLFEGSTLKSLAHAEPFDTSWNELSEVLKYAADMTHFTRADQLKACPFPEVDFVLPEGVVWTTLGEMKLKVIPDIVMTKEYRAPNAISFSGKQDYCRGRATAMAISEHNLKAYPRTLKTRLWSLITFMRLSILGEISFKNQRDIWGSNSSLWLMITLYPLGLLLAVKDLAQGKVRRTHRDFLAASQSVKISISASASSHTELTQAQ